MSNQQFKKIADQIAEKQKLDSPAGDVRLYMPETYRARALHLAKIRKLSDNRGNPSISLLVRTLIDKELARTEK